MSNNNNDVDLPGYAIIKKKTCVQACVDQLARREYGAHELKEKMISKHQYSELDIEESIDFLKENGAQSDERFTDQYVRNYLDRGHGPLLIRQSLKNKGVASELIDIKLEEYEDRIPLTIEKLLRKRDPSNKRFSDRKMRQKQINYLSGKGFSFEQFSRFMKP